MYIKLLIERVRDRKKDKESRRELDRCWCIEFHIETNECFLLITGYENKAIDYSLKNYQPHPLCQLLTPLVPVT